MIAFVDVDYREANAVAACVLASDWTDEIPVHELVERITGVQPYVAGEFYKRELPCLRVVLAAVSEPIDLIVVDGYVWLEGEERPGLGAHLYEALERRIPVVGVAKTQFLSARLAVPVVRGTESRKPLFVTAVGMDVNEAARQVAAMHGTYRLPTLLRRVDALCRES